MCALRSKITAAVVSPLLPEPPVTGGQKRTLRLLETMERAGLHPYVLTTDQGAPGAAAALRERGWGLEIVDEPPPGRAERIRQHVKRRPSPYLHALAARLAAVPAALVQLEHTQSAYYGADVPIVLSLHNLDSAMARGAASQRRGLAWVKERNRAAALRAVERRAFGRMNRVLCVSPEDAAAVRRAGGRALLAPNGVDDEFFLPPVHDTGERALFFGHFGYEANRRGIERFLADGWPAVLRARPDARLSIAGGGMDEALRRRLAAVDGVEVLGLVADLPSVVADVRAVVVPIWEGGGTRLKVLEAMAASKPVVGTPLGVSGLGFEPDRHGVTAERPVELGEALAGVLGDPERAARMGGAARALAERYRWAATLSGAFALYTEIVARQRPDRKL